MLRVDPWSARDGCVAGHIGEVDSSINHGERDRTAVSLKVALPRQNRKFDPLVRLPTFRHRTET
jgi:hypothetical protein